MHKIQLLSNSFPFSHQDQQEEPVYETGVEEDQGLCARALYDYQAGECIGQ